MMSRSGRFFLFILYRQSDLKFKSMNGVIIVNTLKKRLFVATTMIWGLSVTLPVLAEYKPIEQPVEPANPSLKN